MSTWQLSSLSQKDDLAGRMHAQGCSPPVQDRQGDTDLAVRVSSHGETGIPQVCITVTVVLQPGFDPPTSCPPPDRPSSRPGLSTLADMREIPEHYIPTWSDVIKRYNWDLVLSSPNCWYIMNALA